MMVGVTEMRFGKKRLSIAGEEVECLDLGVVWLERFV
jgi:hypothetical protein